MKNKTLLVIAGPTAVGKTSLCVELAQQLNTEIISADARQIYREMHIGTAQPSPEEMKGITHHFIASHSIFQTYSAGQYEQEALTLLQDRFRQHDLLILTGGSGLYIKAICKGLDKLPAADNTIRKQLHAQLQQEGLAAMQAQLRSIDPEAYNRLDISNPRRVLRALEVYYSSGKPFSSFLQGAALARPFRIVGFVLSRPRQELYERIRKRVHHMIDNGLWQEAQRLYPFRHLPALQTVGYQELFAVIDQAYSLEKAIALIQQNSCRYAKRQLTWFRHQHPDFSWIDLSQGEQNAMQYILRTLDTH